MGFDIFDFVTEEEPLSEVEGAAAENDEPHSDLDILGMVGEELDEEENPEVDVLELLSDLDEEEKRNAPKHFNNEKGTAFASHIQRRFL